MLHAQDDLAWIVGSKASTSKTTEAALATICPRFAQAHQAIFDGMALFGRRCPWAESTSSD